MDCYQCQSKSMIGGLINAKGDASANVSYPPQTPLDRIPPRRGRGRSGRQTIDDCAKHSPQPMTAEPEVEAYIMVVGHMDTWEAVTSGVLREQGQNHGDNDDEMKTRE
uniref:Uncharacterized protein n=1 Tax=Oryza glumipatula TaxID=40148 RepID=A0A0E0AR82_9ORYZ